MNKLAVLAFTLLVFLSSMLWYLANGSLNEYLKSQIELQGHYYSGQKMNVDLADFSSSTGTGKFTKISLLNLSDHQAQHAVTIDVVHIALVRQPTQPLLTTIKEITINKLTLNSEIKSAKTSNIDQLIEIISSKLAHDYPELYPNISAKIYAKNNPQLNAEEYAKNNPQAGPIIDHTKAKKKRGKPQAKINISTITINTVELNIIHNGLAEKILLNDVKLVTIGGKQGIITNQLGGEVLLALLNLVPQS
ncbi:MAG: hypothetical protein QNK36_20465 [Colwellia sp.]|nr:hypothetical protein [Colwellia sp.]